MKTKKKKVLRKRKKSVTKEVGGWEAGFELKVEEEGGGERDLGPELPRVVQAVSLQEDDGRSRVHG